MLKNYSDATIGDVDQIVGIIRALRNIKAESKVQTSKTQSYILRSIPAEVLIEVALKLEQTPLVAALSQAGR